MPSSIKSDKASVTPHSMPTPIFGGAIIPSGAAPVTAQVAPCTPYGTKVPILNCSTPTFGAIRSEGASRRSIIRSKEGMPVGSAVGHGAYRPTTVPKSNTAPLTRDREMSSRTSISPPEPHLPLANNTPWGCILRHRYTGSRAACVFSPLWAVRRSIRCSA